MHPEQLATMATLGIILLLQESGHYRIIKSCLKLEIYHSSYGHCFAMDPDQDYSFPQSRSLRATALD